MLETVKDLVFNFFLHIQINTLNLPYRKLPRPYHSNLISRFFRRVFEANRIKSIIGANLAAAMIISPMLIDSQREVAYEPPLNITRSDVLITDSYLPQINTEETTYVVPVERLRYVGQEYHSGHFALDLNSYVGDSIYALSSGRVHKMESGTFGYGRYIILDHGHGLTSIYAHLKDFSVTPGEVVAAGQEIGQVGMTGYTTGPHLHFEIHDNGIAVNPRLYLDL